MSSRIFLPDDDGTILGLQNKARKQFRQQRFADKLGAAGMAATLHSAITLIAVGAAGAAALLFSRQS